MDATVPFQGTDGEPQFLKLRWIGLFSGLLSIMDKSKNDNGVVHLRRTNGQQLKIFVEFMKIKDKLTGVDHWPLVKFFMDEENYWTMKMWMCRFRNERLLKHTDWCT
ncbi:hypothetical protein L596_006071 [Steinernema carpocapsae]|uniref:Uncharacterized protein n=1 Tax=Steinernema carpocapsae TaxID=34508 RepID=A0A4U8V2J8_STECR|nr:hypothetical protein L596_006071 [Steinernema carpocapsae]